MATKTMAQGATARAEHEVATATPSRAAHSFFRRGVLYTAAAAGRAGVQLMTAGPAAVATIPISVRIQEVVAAQEREPSLPIQLAVVPRDASLVVSILDEAFPAVKPPIPALAPEVAEDLDPNEMMSFGGKSAPRWLVGTLVKAAEKTGVDPVYLMTLADVESSLEPRAKAPTSSAEGLFQFIDQTWLEILDLHAASYGFTAAAEAVRMVNDEVVVADESKRNWVLGLKRDPYLAAVMAGELIKDVQRALQAEGERELAEAELYLAHFFGPKAAVRFLKALDEEPDAVAARLFPKAAKANLGLFSEQKGRKRRSITVAELYDRIDSKILRRLNRYDVVAPKPTTLPIPKAASAFTASASPF
jgi:hypothetical protein